MKSLAARNIEPAFLQKKFPESARMIKRGDTWDEIGIAMVRGFHRSGSRRQAAPEPRRAVTPEAEWYRAKDTLMRLFCSDSADLQDIRKRLGDSSSSATPMLVATLSLWLAGHLGKPATMTTPLVATVLLGMVRKSDAVESKG